MAARAFAYFVLESSSAAAASKTSEKADRNAVRAIKECLSGSFALLVAAPIADSWKHMI
jgi:hypothetical protein